MKSNVWSSGLQITAERGRSMMLRLATQMFFCDTRRKIKWGDYCVKFHINKLDMTPDFFTLLLFFLR